MKAKIFGNAPTRSRKLQILLAILAVLLAVDGFLVWQDARQATFGTLYIATVGKIRMP